MASEVLRNLSSVDFVAALAGKEPVPGGGGAAALCGAIGAALGNMVINLTLGKKRYAEYEATNLQLQIELTELQQDLLLMIDRDAEGFKPLAAAYGIKAETEEEKAAKKETLQAALKGACAVPQEIAYAAYRAIALHAQLARTGSRLALSDVACGVQALRAALFAARVNVLINLAMLEDEAFVAQQKERIDRLCREGSELADKVYAQVEAEIWEG